METWWCWSGSLLRFAEPHSVKFSVFAETRVEFVSFSFALLDISVFYCLLITFSSPISSPELFCCCWMFSVLSEPTNHYNDYNIRSMNEAKCFNEQFTILSTFTAAYYQCFSPLWFWSGISHDYYTDTDLQINSNVQFDLQNRAAAFQNTLTKAVCVNWDTEKHFQISKSHFITMIVSPNCMLFKV